MLDEFGSEHANDYIAGFPEHPHRGFQTVTYMLNGKMEHKDSVGNRGTIEAGGIQWMNAGKGIIHSEMPKQTQGLMRGFQLWVNLPAAEKMSAPAYQDIPPHQVPTVSIGARSCAKVLAGELNGVQGPVATQAVRPQYLDIQIAADDITSLAYPSDHNGFVYCYEGEITIAGQRVKQGELAVIESAPTLEIASNSGAKLILVSAKPINEAVVQYGPFVMNTQEEINQALKDFQQGRLA